MTPAIPHSLATLCTEAARGARLDPSAAPEALAEQHRREVAEHLTRHPGATVEELSAALTLPVWNITRAIAAIRGEALPAAPRKAHTAADRKRAGFREKAGAA